MIWPAYTGVWPVSYTLHSHDKRKPLWSVLETMEFYGKTFVFKEQVFGVFYINSCGQQTFQDYAKQTIPSSPWILVFPSVIHRLNVCSFSQSVWLARCFSLSVNVKSRLGEGLNIVKAWHTCSVWNIPSHSVSMTNVYILYRAVQTVVLYCTQQFRRGVLIAMKLLKMMHHRSFFKKIQSELCSKALCFILCF